MCGDLLKVMQVEMEPIPKYRLPGFPSSISVTLSAQV